MSVSPVVPDPALYLPTQEERTSAMLPHILQIFGGFVPPLVVLIVKRDSRYVRFHSLQALIWQGIATVALVIGFVSFFIIMFASIATLPQNSKEMPKGFLLFPLVWLLFMGQYAVSIVLAIIYGWQCSNGKWARYPLIWRLAMRWSK